MTIPTLQDVERMLPQSKPTNPQLGEKWETKGCGTVTVIEVNDARGFRGGIKTRDACGRIRDLWRDGRRALMGARGACDEDLMRRVGTGENRS